MPEIPRCPVCGSMDWEKVRGERWVCRRCGYPFVFVEVNE